MTQHEIQIRVHELLGQAHAAYNEAENVLLEARKHALEKNDSEMLETVLQSLSHLYVEKGTRAKAEEVYKELERVFPEAYVKLDFATFYFDVLHEFKKAIAKVQEIPRNPKHTNFDASSLYSALNLKGRAFLRLGDTKQAKQVLRELVQFIQRYSRPLFGYEMLFVNEMLESRLLPDVCKKYIALAKGRDCPKRNQGNSSARKRNQGNSSARS